MLKEYIVTESKRIDKLLAQEFSDHSRSYFQALIEAGAVTCNGKGIKKRDIPPLGAEIQIFFAKTPEIQLEPEEIPLDILYEDEELICINKPAGMVVHPAPGHPSGTFVNALLHHCKNLPENELRPGIVHRLDKETSGVLLAAKTTRAHQKLIETFSNRQMKKEYLAIVVGRVEDQSFEAPIGRHPKKRKEMAIIEEGRYALTHFKTLETKGEFSLIQALPVTGRTHQIRVHLKALHAPVLGDTVYGSEKLARKLNIKRHLLHAHKLSFDHPFTGKSLTLEAPLPADFLHIL